MKKQSKGFTLVELLVVIGILGILMGALFPAISGVMNKAKMMDCKSKGKKLFEQITAAGLNNHPDKDGYALWPRSTATRGSDDTDISGKSYSSSLEYFKDLFDMDNYGSTKWRPYLGKDIDTGVLCGCGVPSPANNKLEAKNVMWCVAQGVSDNINESVPVLVTRNAQVETLFTTGSFAGTENTEVGIGKENGGESNTPFGDEAFVVVRRGGSIDSIEARYAKLYQIYNGKAFTIDSSEEFKYLKTGAN